MVCMIHTVLCVLYCVPMQSGGAFPFDPTAEPQYAWHTSIAERQDNIFLRPLVPLPPAV